MSGCQEVGRGGNWDRLLRGTGFPEGVKCPGWLHNAVNALKTTEMCPIKW